MSKDFIIYEKETGEIVTMGTMPNPDIYPVKDNEAMIVGRLADRKTQRVSADGRIIQKRADIIEETERVELWRAFRNERANLLARSDWTQVPDSPHTAEERQAWAEYRQALRDLPKNIKDIYEIPWPKPPGNT